MGKSDPGYDQAGVLQSGGTDHVVQTMSGAVSGLVSTPALANVGSAASPDWRVFVMPGYGGPLNSYSIVNGLLSLSPISTSNDVNYGNLSGSPSLTQNGTTNSIVWAIDRGTGTLRAYDATNLTSVLYTSALAPLNRDQFSGLPVKFSVPTVADGRVFVGTTNAFLIYGPPTLPTSPPAAPTSLTAAAPFPSQAVLKWTDNASNEDLFSIERSPDGIAGWTEVGQASANAVTFTDNSAAANTTYYYRVRAFNSFGGGSYSDYTNVATVTTTANPGGSGDGLLGTYYNNIDFTGAVVQQIDPQINFDWGGGAPVAGIGSDFFSVAWTGILRPPSSGNYTFFTTSDDGVRLYIDGQLVISNWTDHGATEDASQPLALSSTTTYTIRMEFYEDLFLAAAQLRWSSESVPKSLIPQSALYSGTAPAAPSNLAAAPASGTQINLSWSDNALTETGFIVQRKQGATGTYDQVAIVPPNSTSYLDGELLAGTTYYYRVQAANFVSNSDFSNEASAATPVPPATPSNAHPTAVTTTSIAFAWQDNSNNEDKFSIFHSVNNGSFIFVADVPTNTTTYTDTGLSPGTAYDYHIQAWNLGGYTDFAGFSIITRTTPPANPTAVVTNGQVSLAWTASPGAVGYNIYRGTSPGGEAAQPIASGAIGTSYVDNGLTPGFTYYYKITAITTGGESAASVEMPVSLGNGDGLLGSYYSRIDLTGTASSASTAR